MKAEVILSLFVGIAVSIGGAYYYLKHYDHSDSCKCSIARPKSNMKQLGTTVAMYFDGQTEQRYPKSPQTIKFDSILIDNSPHKTWDSINQRSQYFFFIYEGKEYTGANDQPLAVGKNLISDTGKYFIVWEDGHVSMLGEKEAQRLKNSFLDGKASKR